MDTSSLFSNLLSPPVLFFFLGLLAVFVKSDLEIPQPIPKVLSLYLLMAIGIKGGAELQHSGLSFEVLKPLIAAIILAVVVPVYAFFILRARLDVKNAAAIAATYGSVSAVTFITAVAFLDSKHIPYGGHMIAGMALMESPAIVIGVLLARLFSEGPTTIKSSWKSLAQESLFNGSVLLILGSLFIAFVSGHEGAKTLEPFTSHIFKGVLCFFLLDMGLLAAARIKDLKRTGVFLIGFAVLLPLLNATLGLGVAWLLGLTMGDAFLLVVLSASASYIAVPAAMRLAIPEANPSLYVPMALGITFPFNITVGLPFYMYLISHFWR